MTNTTKLPEANYYRAAALGNGAYGAVCIAYDDDGNEWYEPPVDFPALAQTYRATAHHGPRRKRRDGRGVQPLGRHTGGCTRGRRLRARAAPAARWSAVQSSRGGA